jgi:hypothetical protein
MVVFDRAYNYYKQFVLWTEKQFFFVTRMKKNAVYTFIETVQEHERIKDKAMVIKEEIIELEYHPEDD